MKRALLVDDDPLVRDLAEELLDICGFTVVTTTNGSEAWTAFDVDGSFDIVVSDLEMPEMDGVTLYKRVRERNADIPFVLMSGNPGKLAQASIVRGAAIGKPFPIEVFMNQVKALVPA